MASSSQAHEADEELFILPLLLEELTAPRDRTFLLAAAEGATRKERRLGNAKVEDYTKLTVPTYSDPLFKAHFRMSRSSFQELMELIGPHAPVGSISTEKRTLASLWCLSNQESFRGVGDRFGMSRGSLHYCLRNFCNILSGTILHEVISWPSPNEYPAIAHAFFARPGFPGVIGAIDGTYIPITGPSKFRDSYICQKGFPAMHLQGVCDSNMTFLDIFCAYPGSVHDSRVFKNSPLHEHLESNPPPRNFHLIGDSAYGLQTYLLNPFRDNGHLSHENKKYNKLHSSARAHIERCFGLLKGKFRRLKHLEMRRVEDVPTVIAACCTLHNFILDKETSIDEDILLQGSNSESPGQDEEISQDRASSTEAQAKKREVMHMLT